MSPLPVRQAVAPGQLPRHRHAEGYVAVVLAGGYEEAGDRGRRRVTAGDVVFHAPWEAHLNRTPGAGAQVLNLPLAHGLAPFGRIGDPDALARAAERDPAEALALLTGEFRAEAAAEPADWPDDLARALARGPIRLARWARERGLSPEHVSRGFRQVFGVGPLAFGRELRARAALEAALRSPAALADVALAHGFADQSHMTRAVAALTGRPPGAWRASIRFKT